ncbi:MAG: hypothetical protein QXE31_06005 [Candidatus Woesearchaeota archaeon]
MKLIKPVKSQYSKLKEFRIRSSLINRILIGSLIILFLSFFVNVKLIFFLVVAAVFNALLQRVQLQTNMPTDFELSTLSTVLVTAAFGLKWGIVNAIFSKLVASIYTGSIIIDHFFMILTYINAAFLTTLFGSSNLVFTGIITVLINNVIMFFISKNILGIDPMANTTYTLTNLVFNSIMFSVLANPLLFLLKL